MTTKLLEEKTLEEYRKRKMLQETDCVQKDKAGSVTYCSNYKTDSCLRICDYAREKDKNGN